MALSKDQELLLSSSLEVEAQNFREIERNGEAVWRWAVGNESSVLFIPPAKNCRVYYRIMVPVAGTKILIHHGETLCLSLSAVTKESNFKGHFEFSPLSEKDTLRFTILRDDPFQLHPVDPQLSFSVQQFFLVPVDIVPDFSERKPISNPMHMVCVALPAWTTFVPPLGVAYIAAAVREAGYSASVFDYNIIAWHLLKNKEVDGKNIWSFDNAKFFRDSNLFERHVLPYLRESMEKFADDICATNPSVIGFTLFYNSFPCFDYIAKACKARLPRVKVVCGGPTITSSYIEGFMDEARYSAMDVAVVGEGEGTMVELLNRWANGKSIDACKGIAHRRQEGLTVVEAPRVALSYASLPFPDFGDFDLSLYGEPDALPVMMSRGCVAKCTFCSETRFWAKYRSDPAERTFHQISSLINGNFSSLSKVVDLIIESKLKFKWVGQARVDKRMTKEFLQRLAASGCEDLFYGFESGSQKIVDLMDKRASVETARQVVRDTQAAGIHCTVNIIVGFPGEEEEDFQMTMNFLQDNIPYIWQVTVNEMDIFWGIPVGDDPQRFGVSTIIPQAHRLWETVDGRNTPAVRLNRMKRIKNFIAEQGIKNWKYNNVQGRV